MADSIFRTQSLETLSSPEQLDHTLKITSPRSWLLLTAFGLVIGAILVWGFTGKIPETIAAHGLVIRDGGLNPIVCLQTGLLERMLIEPGDQIRIGTPVAIIRNTHGKQQIVYSSMGGKIIELLVSEGGMIQAGSAIAITEHQNRPLEAIIFVPQENSKFVKKEMSVALQLSNVRKEDYGVLKGRVNDVGEYPISSTGLKALLNTDSLEGNFLQQGPLVMVNVELDVDESTISRYKWSTKQGPPFEISSGTEISIAQIELQSQRPIELALPIKIDRQEVAQK